MVMPVFLISCGRRPVAVATRFCTSTAAIFRSYPVRKTTLMLLVPSLELVEVM